MTSNITIGNFTQSFIAYDMILVVITQSIRNRVNLAVDERIDQKISTVFGQAPKMENGMKTTTSVKIDDKPTNIVMPDQQSMSSASEDESMGLSRRRRRKRESKSRLRRNNSRRIAKRFQTDLENTTDGTKDHYDSDYSTDIDDTDEVRTRRRTT